MQFKVLVKEHQAIAYPRGILLMPYFLRRMIRKGTDYVEDSFIADCKDATLKIKPFLITRRKVSKKVRRGLREKAKQETIKYLKDKPVSRIFEEILKNKMQKELSMLLKKIYPLALCEIKSIEIEKDLEVKEYSKKVEEKVVEKTLEESQEKPEKEKKEKKEKIKEEERNSEEVEEEVLEK
jgi:ribosomal protein S3AE